MYITNTLFIRCPNTERYIASTIRGVSANKLRFDILNNMQMSYLVWVLCSTCSGNTACGQHAASFGGDVRKQGREDGKLGGSRKKGKDGFQDGGMGEVDAQVCWRYRAEKQIMRR
jgi:hypothetical protein